MTIDPSPDDHPKPRLPEWAPFARALIRRHHAGSDSSPAHAGAPAVATAASRAEKHSDDTDAIGPHPDHLLLLIRWAATWGSEQCFRGQVLSSGSVTVLGGINARELSGMEYLLKHSLVPPDMRVYTRGPRHPAEPVLQLCAPQFRSSGDISSHMRDVFEDTIREALLFPAPMLILVPDGFEFSAPLRRALPEAQRLAPVDRQILFMLITHHYNMVGEAEHARLLPDRETLARLEYPALLMALRAPTAQNAARKLQKLTRPRRPVREEALTLAEIGGNSAAHQAAAALAADVQACLQGTASWSDIPRSLLLYGDPGTGKTMLAQATARSAGLPIIIASAAEWQARGHLGHMLNAMLGTFSQAAAQRPCIVFIDEIDSFGSRDGRDQHNSNYRRQVINVLLKEIDKFLAVDGTLLLGACNAVDTIDPAICRPGRFDKVVELGRPHLRQVAHMLRQVFTEPEEVLGLARLCVGQTPAEIDATVRAAKATARREGIPFDASYFTAHLKCNRPERPALERRIALHEAGHAFVTALLLGASAVERIVITKDVGMTTRGTAIIEGTTHEFEGEMAILLAGRAAEHLVLGDVSAGSGGGPGSDLERATRLQLHCDQVFGLGIHGPAWLGEPDMARLSRADWDRVRVKLQQFEQNARDLLAPHRDLLESLAGALILQREMNAEELWPWLSQITGSN